MAKFKLKTERNKFRVKLHLVVFLIVVIASLAIGYAAGQYGIPGITGSAVKNCIPQKDFQYFLDDANVVRAEYDKCVSDLWSLQFAIKTGGKITSESPVNVTK